MHKQSLSLSEQCIYLLSQPPQTFKRVQCLKKLTRISQNQKYHKTSLFLYCLYCIIHKYDYVQALQAIQKSQGVDQGSMVSIAIGKMIKALLYTFIDKHRDSLSLMKQACSFVKSADSISLEMKNHYKRMVPLIIANLNTVNGKKSFYKFFYQLYDELAKQSSNNQLNEEILYAIHAQIQLLKTQIDFLPTVNNHNHHKTSSNSLQKSLSVTKTPSKPTLTHEQSNDYMGFAKALTKQQKSVNNIRKMIQQKKLSKQSIHQSRSSSSLNKGLTGFGKNTPLKTMLKNQPNPYQLNLYAEEKPQCEFL